MATNHDSAHDHSSHVMPLPVLFGIFGALICLTIVTVAVGQFELGSIEIIVTMIIATTKATLVAVYFMHLRYDNPFNAMVFVFSLAFVALFLGITLLDAESYEPDLIPPTPVVETASN